jgi:hypothetical protein
MNVTFMEIYMSLNNLGPVAGPAMASPGIFAVFSIPFTDFKN